MIGEQLGSPEKCWGITGQIIKWLEYFVNKMERRKRNSEENSQEKKEKESHKTIKNYFKYSQ